MLYYGDTLTCLISRVIEATRQDLHNASIVSARKRVAYTDIEGERDVDQGHVSCRCRYKHHVARVIPYDTTSCMSFRAARPSSLQSRAGHRNTFMTAKLIHSLVDQASSQSSYRDLTIISLTMCSNIKLDVHPSGKGFLNF